MAMPRVMCVLVLLSALASGNAVMTTSRSKAHLAGNPIRKIIDLLESMLANSKDSGKKDDLLAEDNECDCKKRIAEQMEVVKKLAADYPRIKAIVAELNAIHARLLAELQRETTDLNAAKQALEDATNARRNQAAENVRRINDLNTNLNALKKATDTMETARNFKPSFLQTFLHSAAADALRNLVTTSSEMSDGDRDIVTNFLSQGSGDQDEGHETPSASEIIGILKGLHMVLSDDLNKVNAQEAKEAEAFANLKRSLDAQISRGYEQLYRLRREIAANEIKRIEWQAELDDIENVALRRAQKLLDDIKQECSDMEKAYRTRTKTRLNEQKALEAVIETFNTDDNLAVFKKSLPSGGASLLQIQETSREVLQRARSAVLSNIQKTHDYRINLIALSMQNMGRKGVDFTIIVGKIQNMIDMLTMEQDNDRTKKVNCANMITELTDKKKALTRDNNLKEKEIASQEHTVETTAEEIKKIEKIIATMDIDVQEAGEQRKKANDLYMDQYRTNIRAKQLLQFAKDKLGDFYNKETSPDNLMQIRSHNATAFTQLGSESHHKYRATPEVLKKITDLLRTLTLEIEEYRILEDQAQRDYGTFTAAQKAQRVEQVNMLKTKRRAKLTQDNELAKMRKELGELQYEKGENEKTLYMQHADCDWIIEKYDIRRTARDAEKESLRKAAVVLRGGEIVFLQEGQSKQQQVRGLLRGR